MIVPHKCESEYPKVTSAILEPCFNFDACALTITGELNGDDYVLRSDKCYVLLGTEADLLLIYAEENGSTQASIVDKNTPHLEMVEGEKNMGTKALST